jgi:acyl carrier protein
LPAPDIAGNFAHRHEEPGNPIEAGLAEIWAELLGIERVGIHDNFFELGGHSLSAVQAVVRIRERFGIELAVTGLFEAPTVADLALLLAQRQAEQYDAGELDALLKELEQLPEGEAQRLSWELQH